MLLEIKNLSKIYGSGCGHCLELTGAAGGSGISRSTA